MLCGQTDVEQRLQIDFDDDDEPVAANLIAAAQGHIEREAGRPLEETSHEETFDGGRRLLVLTHWPVSDVSEVVEDGTTLAADDFDFYEDGRLIRLSAGYQLAWQTSKRKAIAVTYTGGYDPVPADLVDLCAWLAARAFRKGVEFAARPEGTEGMRRIRLEDREIEFAVDGSMESMTAPTDVETAWVRAAYAREVVA